MYNAVGMRGDCWSTHLTGWQCFDIWKRFGPLGCGHWRLSSWSKILATCPVPWTSPCMQRSNQRLGNGRKHILPDEQSRESESLAYPKSRPLGSRLGKLNTVYYSDLLYWRLYWEWKLWHLYSTCTLYSKLLGWYTRHGPRDERCDCCTVQCTGNEWWNICTVLHTYELLCRTLYILAIRGFHRCLPELSIGNESCAVHCTVYCCVDL